VRVGEIDGNFAMNLTNEEMLRSRLDLIYVGNEKDMIMIEGNADQLPEERFIEALAFAHEQIQPLTEAQRELARLCGKPKKHLLYIRYRIILWKFVRALESV
jgi:polyribonucleotide nucleotidyltransferase